MINEINTFFFQRCQNELLRSQISPDTSLIYENHTQGERENTSLLSEAYELSKNELKLKALHVPPVLTLLEVKAVGSDFHFSSLNSFEPVVKAARNVSQVLCYL